MVRAAQGGGIRRLGRWFGVWCARSARVRACSARAFGLRAKVASPALAILPRGQAGATAFSGCFEH
eukprot:7995445-Lingulodinium_polyedra.AAC.1